MYKEKYLKYKYKFLSLKSLINNEQNEIMNINNLTDTPVYENKKSNIESLRIINKDLSNRDLDKFNQNGGTQNNNNLDIDNLTDTPNYTNSDVLISEEIKSLNKHNSYIAYNKSQEKEELKEQISDKNMADDKLLNNIIKQFKTDILFPKTVWGSDFVQYNPSDLKSNINNLSRALEILK